MRRIATRLRLPIPAYASTSLTNNNPNKPNNLRGRNNHGNNNTYRIGGNNPNNPNNPNRAGERGVKKSYKNNHHKHKTLGHNPFIDDTSSSSYNPNNPNNPGIGDDNNIPSNPVNPQRGTYGSMVQSRGGGRDRRNRTTTISSTGNGNNGQIKGGKTIYLSQKTKHLQHIFQQQLNNNNNSNDQMLASAQNNHVSAGSAGSDNEGEGGWESASGISAGGVTSHVGLGSGLVGFSPPRLSTQSQGHKGHENTPDTLSLTSQAVSQPNKPNNPDDHATTKLSNNNPFIKAKPVPSSTTTSSSRSASRNSSNASSKPGTGSRQKASRGGQSNKSNSKSDTLNKSPLPLASFSTPHGLAVSGEVEDTNDSVSAWTLRTKTPETALPKSKGRVR